MDIKRVIDLLHRAGVAIDMGTKLSDKKAGKLWEEIEAMKEELRRELRTTTTTTP